MYNIRLNINHKGGNMAVPIEKVVEAYIQTREKIKAIEAETKDRLSPLKELQEKREQWLYNQLQQIGCKNIKTDFGTVYTARTESVTVSDKDLFINWVKEGNNFAYMDIRANKTSVLELMGEERENNPPPGVNYVSIATVQIRRS